MKKEMEEKARARQGAEEVRKKQNLRVQNERAAEELMERVKLDRGNLICVGARPGMGKTALGLFLALEYARGQGRETGKGVYILTQEGGELPLKHRLIWDLVFTPDFGIVGEQVAPKRWYVGGQAEAVMRERKIVIDHTVCTVAHLQEVCATGEVGMIVVDDLSHLSGTGGEEPERETAELLRGLSRLSRDYGIPVLFTAGVGRRVEKRWNKHPRLGDLSHRAMEHFADTVLLIYRRGYYLGRYQSGDVQEAEIHVAKNRYGKVGRVKLLWNRPCGSFRSERNIQR